MVHISADGLIDYVKLIFHIDMGDGHLENFSSGHNLDFDFNSTAAITPLVFTTTDYRFLLIEGIPYNSSEYYLDEDPFPDSPCCGSFSLRGPPFIS